MNLSRDIKVGLALLLGLNLMTAFSSISVLERMEPAIETVIKENVRSLEMVEEMFSALFLPAQPARDTAANKQRFTAALKQARESATEEQEPVIIAAIESAAEQAFGGNAVAIKSVVENLQRLGEVNRNAMRRAEERANRLRLAGAWAMAMLGLMTFLSGLFVFSRFGKRIVYPVQELVGVATAWKEGNRQRRYHSPAASRELEEIGKVLNAVLDESMDKQFEERRELPQHRAAGAKEREIISGLLESFSAPSFVISSAGVLLSANAEGIKRLSRQDGAEIREQLALAPKRQAQKSVSKSAPIGNTGFWLCELKPEVERV
ncbi:MAG: hypothetical protein A2428_10680 [Bdellovibrionales bacterium RIFOXYC1_FULL_54_43]|nr:MAG: hypothetical protein A2428_10680 [Bdellovibrionales bacterium RIFOXYC1_FULL_54_43]OFZ85356.1 MAG: hypothetical protein A2603_05455 [Bdellovibrionales bacterium RIFOXYD1_FULL_55_31]